MSQRPPVKNLDALSDAVITSPTNNQALLYNTATSKWINAAIPNTQLSTLTDVQIATPVDDQLLKYDSASSKWQNYGPLGFADLDPASDIAVSQIANGTGASSTTFFRGDNTWASPITADAGTSGNLLTSDGVNWVSSPPAGPVKIISLTTAGSGNYTVSTGARALKVECWGGGGGGGGAKGTATPASGAGGGGSGAGYAMKYVTGAAMKSVFAYVIGGGGAGGLSTPAVGSNGVDTTFDSPSICTGPGGVGGNPSGTAGTTPQFHGSGGNAPGVTVADFGIRGSSGSYGIILAAGSILGGVGGGAGMGGGLAAGAFNNAGVTGRLYGGGGGGASSTSATGFAGGDGAQGAIRITEFF